MYIDDAQDDDHLSSEFNNQMDLDGQIQAKVNEKRIVKDSQDIMGQEDEEMKGQEEVISIRDHGDSDSVSLICQEKVDTLAEDQAVPQKDIVMIDQKDP